MLEPINMKQTEINIATEDLIMPLKTNPLFLKVQFIYFCQITSNPKIKFDLPVINCQTAM